MARLSMLIDMARCIGCDACTVACKQENGTPLDTFFARVLNIEAGKFPDVQRIYLPMLCYHCEEPACLKACPNKAIFKRPDGIVLIDQDRCRGTGACVSACPYGNIILSDKSSWYLNEDEPYEKDFVKPRLKEGVARKCTYCAHRVDDGLDPACVVACPTNARIFGDLDDEDSAISQYVVRQRESGREPFKLLPQAGTKPAGMYLGPLEARESSSSIQPETTRPSNGRSARKTAFGVGVVLLLVFLLIRVAGAQAPISNRSDIFTSTSCAGCHGQEAMGGLGPPLAGVKLPYDQFLSTVRHGKGMMPKTDPSVLSDEQVKEVYRELQAKPWLPDQIPISYKVGSLLTTHNLGIIYSVVYSVAFLLGVMVLARWLKVAGLGALWPHLKKFGLMRSAWVTLKALVVDGFCVASLWRRNRFRWFMHGLMIYGFVGLAVADALMQIYNPTRSELPLGHPLKLFPVLSGLAVIAGVFYVQIRYRQDRYIDNGVTLGRDFLFVNLLFQTVFSGFLTVLLKRSGQDVWVMPVYLYHLVAMTLLILTAPFTRFSHAFVAPFLIAMTRLADAVTASGVEIGFEREPSPGRHHKSMRIADQIVGSFAPESSESIRIRYYP